MEVWGAQGGMCDDWISGGKGGYAKGSYSASYNQKMFVTIGEVGRNGKITGSMESLNRSYNGGGAAGAGLNGYGRAGAGGGATHIATSNRGELKKYKSYQAEVLIVAGGGGGSTWYNNCSNVTGGAGGGTNGGNGTSYQNTFVAYGGTQTTGYAFGEGQDGLHPTQNGGNASDEGCGGGGGGWYGGKSSNATESYGRNYNTAGGGGSGHINTSLVQNGSMQTGVREGNGYALITWMPVL